MNIPTDKILCRDLIYQARIGILPQEKTILQKLWVDFDADVPQLNAEHQDEPGAIVLDYFQAHLLLQTFFDTTTHELIETVADDIAKILLNHFAITAVTVTVTKWPMGLPDGASAAYQCRRVRGSLAGHQ